MINRIDHHSSNERTMAFLSKKDNLIRRADQERDCGNWEEAASLYRQCLARNGINKKNFGILVQLGNCLKEAGDFSESLKIYDMAMRLKASDSDLFLQKGHLLKLMGRKNEADFAYHRSYILDPNNQSAQIEIEANGSLASHDFLLDDSSQSLKTIWFDITDLVDYARCNVSLSGIQRVCVNLINYMKVPRLKNCRFVPVLPDYGRKEVFSVSMKAVLNLVKTFEQECVNLSDIHHALSGVIESKTLQRPQKGDSFVMAGAFWIFENYDLISDLKHEGVLFGLFIHDLIQIRDAEYVMPDAKDKFSISFSNAADLCDYILTNSEYVKHDVEKYFRESKFKTIPVESVLLPTELRGTSSKFSITNEDIRFVAKHPYVLCVSTIEVRKNHKFLISIWEKLISEMDGKVPFLVLVGKWGWQIDSLRQYIEKKGYLGDWLFVFNGISDLEVEYLYKNCLFSIYPSFAEGFGLPIGESLVYGKPCIASSTTSMPEVGGDFVRYIDPFDWKSAYPIVRQAITDGDDLEKWTQRVKNDFKIKKWDDFSKEFFDRVYDFSSSLHLSPRQAFISLPEEYVMRGGSNIILTNSLHNKKLITFDAARFKNWHPTETWGCWSSKRRCEIAFATALTPKTPVSIFLALHRVPSGEENPTIILEAGADEQRLELTEYPTFYRFNGTVTEEGLVHIKLLARGKFPSTNREIYVGWTGLAYCDSTSEKNILNVEKILIPSAA